MASVEEWLAGLDRGDSAAQEHIWQRYFEDLVRQARRHLTSQFRRVSDEEDVALSVLDSLYRGAKLRKFPNLQDRNDLWRLLLTLVRHKAIDRVSRESRKRRGGGQVRGDSVWRAGGEDGDQQREPADDTPSAEMATLFAEELQKRFAMLPDDEFRRIATLKMEGVTNASIARELGCSEATIERRLARIRTIWSKTPRSDE